LIRSLYGLPQAGRNWNSTIHHVLTELSFQQLREDLCAYVLFENGKTVAFVAIYVDDILPGFDTEERKNWFIQNLERRFSTKVIGLPTNVLGLHISWKSIEGAQYFESVKIKNARTINSLIKRFNIEKRKKVNLPFNQSVKLSKSQCPNSEDLNSDTKLMQNNYRILIGSFIWIYTTTRPDIAYIMLILCSYVSNPAYQHFEAAIWLLRYLSDTKDLGISYEMNGEQNLLGYVDADYAAHEDRKSIFNYIFLLANGPISWKNGFESRYSLSTAESELRAIHALKEAIKHILYLKKLFREFAEPTIADSATLNLSIIPQIIYEDNQSTIRWSLNPSGHSTMKHLEVDIYWIHEAITNKELTLYKIDSPNQLADIGTKANNYATFISHRDRIQS
jgi:hypothetical protein